MKHKYCLYYIYVQERIVIRVQWWLLEKNTYDLLPDPQPEPPEFESLLLSEKNRNT